MSDDLITTHITCDLPDRVKEILRDDVVKCPPVDLFILGHTGSFVWRNSAELVWECDDDCPHPCHDHEGQP